MAIPPLARFARPVSGDMPDTPGRYDTERGLRVFDTSEGPVPVVAARCPDAFGLTKTDHRRERDDDGAGVLSQQEAGSFELGSNDGCSGALLELVTKTLRRPERDDEP